MNRLRIAWAICTWVCSFVAIIAVSAWLSDSLADAMAIGAVALGLAALVFVVGLVVELFKRLASRRETKRLLGAEVIDADTSTRTPR